MGKDFTAGNASNNCVREAVCIHTDKVYDSCRDKECIEDLRVYFPVCHQALIDSAMNVKLGGVEILWVQTDVEPLSFNQGYYTVDIRFFFKVYIDVYYDLLRTKRIEGLAVYDKKVVLFGSEGRAKIFQSLYQYQAADQQLAVKNNLPKAVVEVVDPVPLNARLVERCQNNCCDLFDISSTPDFICNCFEDVFASADTEKRVYITIGLFSIIKLERSVQLLIPVYDFCVPSKECVSSTAENPCELFESLDFPVDEFYPPVNGNDSGCCNCGCN